MLDSNIQAPPSGVFEEHNSNSLFQGDTKIMTPFIPKTDLKLRGFKKVLFSFNKIKFQS